MRRMLLAALRMVGVTIVACGLVYPLLVTGLAQIVFPRAANGSLVMRDGGRVIGSELIGQRFVSPRYFHGRPSAAGGGYDALASGASNLAPSSRRLSALVTERAREAVADAPALEGDVPVDLVTASGSGLDPHISPAAAYAQVDRVAKARGMTPEAVRRIVDANIESRQLWVFGELRVNVLLLNLALDGK